MVTVCAFRATTGYGISQGLPSRIVPLLTYPLLYPQPIQDVTSDSVACNGPPNDPLTSSSDVITVQAGSTIQGFWRHAEGDVIDPSHKV